MVLEIKESTIDDINTFNQWQKHESIHKWIFIDDWAAYYNIFKDDPDYYILSIFSNDVLIGEISAQINKNETHISLLIEPNMQGKGFGTAALKKMFMDSTILFEDRVKSFIAGISPRNISSVRCFERAGFTFKHNGNDGELIYEVKTMK